MKSNNKLIHTVDITNEDNETATIKIDSADMIQVNNIGKLFLQFDGLKDMVIPENATFKESVEAIDEIAQVMENINLTLDKAFGPDLRTKVFKGSSSIVVYNEFFMQLADELTKAGTKVQDYIKDVRGAENDAVEDNII